ncbi:hypothetical protein Q4Q35_11270 [Flavivirga aquimarina]|uniref:Lipoprotein n=1 Tax=Flavivirga aquimarina TaxID=2027862 RepID=A0ABT8WB97_9FLAO|nr:hypothetical protein [Flavivirga aquimarina]MDO5970385.1 hypothetical protein [Flavivirga aquimarina]
MKSLFCTIFFILLFGCIEKQKNHKEESYNNCDQENILTIESLIINDLKETLENEKYQSLIKQIENKWLSTGILTSDNSNGYIQLLNLIIDNDGLSDSIVHPINHIIYNKQSKINLYGIVKTFSKIKGWTKDLSPKCSVKKFATFVNYMQTSKNIYSTKVSENLLEMIKQEDLNKQFYQDLVILSFISIL